MKAYKNPAPTVDLIIETPGGNVFIERKNEPAGLALPGGFVDEGELLEHAAIREAREETGLEVTLIDLLYVYSHPDRDLRKHTISVVFVAKANGTPIAGDDASRVFLHPPESPPDLVFDHNQIYHDYLEYKKKGKKPGPTTILNRWPGYQSITAKQ